MPGQRERNDGLLRRQQQRQDDDEQAEEQRPRRQSSSSSRQEKDGMGLPVMPPEEYDLRFRIVSHLRRCGFFIGVDGAVRLPPGVDMGEAYRRVQHAAKQEQMARRGAAAMLSGRAYDYARAKCPDGSSIDPRKIDLEIRMIPQASSAPASSQGGGRLADLFRWWNLAWWSMPWQQSYGRRLRYFLWDRQHDAPFGPGRHAEPAAQDGRPRRLSWHRRGQRRAVTRTCP